MKFKVIDQKGIHFGGGHLAEGKIFHADRKNIHIGTFLHFKQIEETDEDEPEEGDEKPGKGKTKPKPGEPPLV